MAIKTEQLSHPAPAAAAPIDVEAWTEQATAAMATVTISLDEQPEVRPTSAAAAAEEGTSSVRYKRKEPLRRDSLKRREALLKGKEGSRRRQRWENDRLLNNPYAEPPSPKDWEVRPTHPVHHVPYYLAPLWDAGLSRQSAERKAAAAKAKVATRTVAKKPVDPGVVPKELREKLKKARGAKGLLMDLESEVRKFVEKWEEKERQAEADGLPADPDSSDDEIVFVGRNGQMNDFRSSEDVKRELMLFETPASDTGGSFGRWLVHHIATYYGLSSWSITVGNPTRREAYIGVRDAKMKSGRRRSSVTNTLPTPLWGMV